MREGRKACGRASTLPSDLVISIAAVVRTDVMQVDAVQAVQYKFCRSRPGVTLMQHIETDKAFQAHEQSCNHHAKPCGKFLLRLERHSSGNDMLCFGGPALPASFLNRQYDACPNLYQLQLWLTPMRLGGDCIRLLVGAWDGREELLGAHDR